MKNTFGAFISEKRLAKSISLRTFSRMIDISPEYLSKIENNFRSAPKDVVLDRIVDKLFLNTEEREKLFDLAAESKPYLTLASDLIEYINENKIVHQILRLAKRCNVSTEDLQLLHNILSEKYLRKSE